MTRYMTHFRCRGTRIALAFAGAVYCRFSGALIPANDFFGGKMKSYLAIFMAAIMTNVPYLAWAGQVPAMIPTSVVVEQMSGQEARSKVQTYLDRQDFKAELVKRGVDPKDVNARVAALNDQELKQLASQMDQAQYGGDIGGILIIVVLVLLIIFLAKRI